LREKLSKLLFTYWRLYLEIHLTDQLWHRKCVDFGKKIWAYNW